MEGSGGHTKECKVRTTTSAKPLLAAAPPFRASSGLILGNLLLHLRHLQPSTSFFTVSFSSAGGYNALSYKAVLSSPSLNCFPPPCFLLPSLSLFLLFRSTVPCLSSTSHSNVSGQSVPFPPPPFSSHTDHLRWNHQTTRKECFPLPWMETLVADPRVVTRRAPNSTPSSAIIHDCSTSKVVPSNTLCLARRVCVTKRNSWARQAQGFWSFSLLLLFLPCRNKNQFDEFWTRPLF